MMRHESNIPIEFLACPRCDTTPLDFGESSYTCSGCNTEYPLLDGLPWLFAEPNSSWQEWRDRWRLTLSLCDQDIERTRVALEKMQLTDAARARLQHRISANKSHRESLSKILAPIDVQANSAEIATYLALRTRLPPDQGLMTYYNNVHRDWSWGDAENAQSLDLVCNALRDHKPKRMLVLGAGAGRLTYDLHSHYQPHTTIGLDFNPLLMLIAAKVSSGESLSMHEFPIAARNHDDYGIARTLTAPSPAAKGLHWLIADTHRPPFAAERFDTIVTPWLIDIVPERFDFFAARINQLLCTDGRWINFGSLSFHGLDPLVQLSMDECEDHIVGGGFDKPSRTSSQIPYMCSPASRHARTEEVVIWSAQKTKKIKSPQRYQALPEWLVRGNEPVPITQGVRTQANSAQVHGFLLSLIDGKRNLRDIAAIAVQRGILSAEEAEGTIRNFLIKMADENSRLGY